MNSRLKSDALAIWHAAVSAAQSDRLVQDNVRASGGTLVVGEEELPLGSIRRIAVVGAGKAGAGMAAGLEAALGPRLLREKQVTGWVNVPADCVRGLTHIHLHAARPAGVNEPTAEGVFGSERVLELVGSLGPDDLCLCLISGGGSALLPAPVPGVSLADKLVITQQLSAGGANIQQLNTVRKQLSRIKGGGLARVCRAGRLISLIISDVLGDPLDVIASGPTVVDSSTPADALAILENFGGAPQAALDYLRSAPPARERPKCRVTNLVIGNNAKAVDAAGQEAVRRGYSPALTAATTLEGPADEIGIHLAHRLRQMAGDSGPDCLITGGEPTVRLAPSDIRGKGGRNQQLVLAALSEFLHLKSEIRNRKFCLLSAGTDGEDGPTDAAGAIIDNELLARLEKTQLDPSDYLRRNDAYSFFEKLGGLIKTGPTHTNVCDVRVVLVDRDKEREH